MICEFSDLEQSSCSHCRGLDVPEVPDRHDVHRYGLAKFSGRCPNCDGSIKSGDFVGYTDDEGGMWICRECAQ